MLKILFDNDFKAPIAAALLQRIPDLDCISARKAGVHDLHDRLLLQWAHSRGRVVLSFDVKTMPRYFADLLSSGQNSSGILLVPSGVKFRQAVADLEYFIGSTEHNEWINRIHILSTRS